MTRDEWLRRYRDRLRERGLPPDVAQDVADNVEFTSPMGQDLGDDPAEAADDELELMGNDEGESK